MSITKQLSKLSKFAIMAMAAAIFSTSAMWAQSGKVSGTVTDKNGEPIVGVYVLLQGTKTGTTTDLDGKYSLNVSSMKSTLNFSCVGYTAASIAINGRSTVDCTLEEDSQMLQDIVVTAFGIKKDRKSLGYAVADVNAAELMKNKSVNPLSSLAGKVAGVNITQGGGAAGAGAQINLRGGTSLERDNQPLFVVDGVIYDNSTNTVGNSAFDGTMSTAVTSQNRLMDINPEDIESMSVLKGPAAAALYGSRAAAGVIIITTKKGKEGAVEVNFSTRYTAQWASSLPDVQKKYGRGYYEDSVDKTTGTATPMYNDFSYQSWGEPLKAGDKTYNNIDDMFETGGAWDTNISVAGGSKTGNFFLSGSHYDQDGIIPTTGYKKETFRFNGEQKWQMFTFGANAAYSQSNTKKTLTSAGLFQAGGNGAMSATYTWAPTDNMSNYANADGSRRQVFGNRLAPEDETENPYWILNRNKLRDNTERFTGSFNVRADITKWWWMSYRMGIDSYTTEDSKLIGAGGAIKKVWQNGMYSENSYRYKYLSTNLMTNFAQSFGDFNFNLMGGLATDDTHTSTNYRMAWNFTVPEFYAFDNASKDDRNFKSSRTKKRLVGVFGEFRADWRNTVFLTVTARNDWSSTLPKDERSYFYPSVSGGVVFTELFNKPDWLSFGKVRASWARVGKDTAPYQLDTDLWPSTQFPNNLIGTSDYWQSGNAFLKPEITESTEIGLELRLFNNRLKFDYAYYTNNSNNQICSPRLSNATGYILRSVNVGDIKNKGMELTIGGTPIETRDWTWETTLNLSGNRGKVKNMFPGMNILYVTDVQVGNAKAASFDNGHFMGISGSEWKRNDKGQIIIDKNGMPTKGDLATLEIGNREPKFLGGWNNTLTYKNLSFNMLWEFTVGGHVYNGTKYAMTIAGVSKFSGNREQITIPAGVDASGNAVPARTFKAGETYPYGDSFVSGKKLIQDYYKDIYPNESRNFMTKVNALRMRTISLTYSLPKSWLQRVNFVKRATISAAANNLLLFTNYDGDPEVAAAGSGSVGSSSVGIDYCGVPATQSFTFSINLTF